MQKLFLILIATFSLIIGVKAQEAELHIRNTSDRHLLIKVMKQGTYDADRYSMLDVDAFSTEIEYFSETGHYFLKTKATRNGRRPIYTKGDPFKVIVSDRGYSVMTITIDIQESYNKIDPLSGEKITAEEWAKN